MERGQKCPSCGRMMYADPEAVKEVFRCDYCEYTFDLEIFARLKPAELKQLGGLVQEDVFQRRGFIPRKIHEGGVI